MLDDINETPAAKRLFDEKSFPFHFGWVKKAKVECSNSSRVVYASFIPSGGGMRIVGSAMFVKSNYRTQGTLKNLIIDNDALKKEEIEQVFSSLVERVVGFCESKGVNNLITEIPTHDNDYISLHLDIGFKITSQIKSPYRTDHIIYRLERDLSDAYYGDPFNLVKISEWLGRKKLGLEIGKETKVLDSCYIQKKDFSFKSDITKKIRGSLYVDSHNRYIAHRKQADNELEADPSGMKLLLTYDGVDQSHGVNVITYRDLQEMCGERNSLKSIEFSFDEIGGLFLDLSMMHTELLSCIQGTAIYITNNGLGSTLPENDGTGKNNLYAFFYNSDNYNEDVYITGYALIESAEYGPLSDFQERYSSQLLWTKSEANYYTNSSSDDLERNHDNPVGGIFIRDIVTFEEGILISNIFPDKEKINLLYENITKYSSSTYLSSSSCNAIIQYIKSERVVVRPKIDLSHEDIEEMIDSLEPYKAKSGVIEVIRFIREREEECLSNKYYKTLIPKIKNLIDDLGEIENKRKRYTDIELDERYEKATNRLHEALKKNEPFRDQIQDYDLLLSVTRPD